ncbi:MAG: phenylalanine--tRNA ligase subunit beta [Thermoplasmata archaeon]|nr:phenylalanine--tRNA ligase subunit beta [Thermoplasmata archaeon]
MTVVTFDYWDMISLLGRDVSREELIKKIPMIGASLERLAGDEISIEIFPDRADMLSVEGIARAMRNFLGIEKGLKKYKIAEPKVEIYVDESVEQVRPFIYGCVIRNIEFNDKSIASLMDLQEKLHFSIGKERKKMAIGVHDFDKVVPPFTYKGVNPNEIKFVPLASNEEMNLNEILEKHEKGKAYAHLLKGKKRYPIIVDKNENVLSFPPIINGQLTAVTEETKNIFIDVTGIEEKAVMHAMNIIATSLAERGGAMEQVKIINGKEKKTPDLTPYHTEVKLSYIKKIIGIDVDAKKCLEKMGHSVKIDGSIAKVISPAWRMDILHPIDIVEDIAIGYGYNLIPDSLPKEITFGESFDYGKIHGTMIGLGFNEVLTLTLSSKKKEFEDMNIKGKTVEVENPISMHHSIIRYSLIPSLLEILSRNKHNDLPQQIYEFGDVIQEMQQKKILAGVKIDAKTNFTECKSIVEAILRNFGLKMDVEEIKHHSFIDGRCASIIVNGKHIGYFGEINPDVITKFSLEYPVIAFEMDASFLSSP